MSWDKKVANVIAGGLFWALAIVVVATVAITAGITALIMYLL